MEGGRVGNSSRKIMVVADPSRESAAALQYALSHVVLGQDELILVHVQNPNTWRNTFSSFLKLPSLSSSASFSSSSSSSSSSASSPPSSHSGPLPMGGGSSGSEAGGPGDGHFLEEMKRICEIAQPTAQVSVECVAMEGTKAGAILLVGDKLGVDTIIIGQRRTLSSAILGSRRSGGSLRGAKGIDTAEYLIENSKCTCVGVQKKGQNGGYLLNTKTHKNFWLLA